MKILKGYIFSRSFFNERVPQHIQNLVLRNYCQVNKLQYLLSATEYAMKESSLMLNKLIKELKDIDGLIFYSLFQLPENDTERQKIATEFFFNGKSSTLSSKGFTLAF